MSGTDLNGHLLDLVHQVTTAAGKPVRASSATVGDKRVELFDENGAKVGQLSRRHWDLLAIEAEKGLEAARSANAHALAGKRQPKQRAKAAAPDRCPSCSGKEYSPRPVALGRLCQDLFHAPKEGAAQ